MREQHQPEDRRVLERLALRDWSPEANAHVVSVTVAGNRAEVVLLVDGDYGYWMYFERDHEGLVRDRFRQRPHGWLGRP